MWWLAILALVIYFVYYYTIKPLDYWKQRNVAYKKPWPILGNTAEVVFRKKNIVENIRDLYNEFPDKRYNGIFSFTKPQLLIRDPELIKQVTIKDFDYFVNRSNQFIDDTNPISSKNLVVLQGQEWRDMRATLSPTFTSSKMRFMFTLLSDCAQQITQYFEKQGSNVISVEMKDLFSRFTNDAIATSAFGVTVDSVNDKNNEFFVLGKETTSVGGLRGLIFLGYSICPALMKFLRIPLFPTKSTDFFRGIVKETIEVRKTNGVVRPDMIHLLLETRKGKMLSDEEQDIVADAGFAVAEEVDNQKQRYLSVDDITAQAFLFFFAGFETASTLMSFMSHELAINPDVQEKLQREIDETLEKCDGKVTYEGLLGMKYLDMVVSESLRKWTPGIALDRICDKDYVITPQSPSEAPFTIEKGVPLLIPVIALHYDSKYFPNPEKFDPERFSEENKANIVPCTYLPFGVGPRNCIASRFALMETKILFFHLLSKFDIVPTEKTPIPLVISRKSFVLAPDGGFWLGLQQRKIT